MTKWREETPDDKTDDWLKELDQKLNEPLITVAQPQPCSHEWVKYCGLKETFTYCKHCDIKS